MKEEQRETEGWKAGGWVWIALLLIPMYFLSAVVVQVVCILFPPSVAVTNVLVSIYLPVILLIQQFPMFETLFVDLTEWLASLFRP